MIVDRKFIFVATSLKSGKQYTERNAMVFLLKDALLPFLLDKYINLCVEHKVDSAQITGVKLLKERVLNWQRKNINKVKLPDIQKGKEKKYVCKPNKKEVYM